MLLPIEIKATYDPETDVLYIYVPGNYPAPIATMPVNANTLVDINAQNVVVGIELLQYSKLRTNPVKKKATDERTAE